MSSVSLVKTWEDGTAEYKLTGGGIEVVIYSLGGLIQSIKVPNKEGCYADISLGQDAPQDYKTSQIRGLIGRFGNRIGGGKFSLDGVDYQLALNNGPNHLHGGTVGFEKRQWQHMIEENKLVLTYTSVDMEENYPGTLKVKVTFEVTQEAEILIDYQAGTDKPTIVNLTHHVYFNLEGHDKGDIYNHRVVLSCNEYTPVDSTSIPTGEIASVQDTHFDLREETPLTPQQLHLIDGKGYDHNYVIPGEQGNERFVARISAGGRVMDTYTTQPAVQFYTGYFLDGRTGKQGAKYNRFSGFCLESQNYPDAPNKPNFPSCVLRPGETYHHKTWYKFTTE